MNGNALWTASPAGRAGAGRAIGVQASVGWRPSRIGRPGSSNASQGAHQGQARSAECGPTRHETIAPSTTAEL